MEAQSLFSHFHRRWHVPVLILVAISSNACGPTPTPDLPICSPEALVRVELEYPMPDGVFIDDLTPTFSWIYPDATCRPEDFAIQVSPNFAGMFALSHRDVITMEVGGTTYTWTPTEPLEPATLYYWQVFSETGISNQRAGPYNFYTNPRCGSEETPSLSAPTPVWPEDGAVLSYITYPRINFLSWTDSPSCIPEGNYLVELSTDPSFTYAESATTRYTAAVIGRTHEFTTPLINCARYYWRVRMDLEGRPDSEDGPWSPVWSFYTNEGGMCATMPRIWITPIPPFDFPIPGGGPGGVPGEPSSWIDGYVWHDLCAVPYESTDIVPPGCVALPEGGFEANGLFDAGEPGLEGVTVDLGAGPCPSTDLATAVTVPGGHYTFGPLAAGTYCVSINPLSEANISVLIPGSFTFPTRGCDVAEYEITLSDADIRRHNNFGWDFQFLPSPGSGAPTAKLLRNSNCRKGPSINYESLMTLFQDMEVPIDGRNAEKSWWWVRIPNSLNHCWLAAENVETSGDADKAPVVEAEPLGCWVWTGNKNECKVPCPQGADPKNACEP